MHAFAIFAVNEHLAELQTEAARESLLKQQAARPGAISTFVARVVKTLRAPEAAPSTTFAFFSPVK